MGECLVCVGEASEQYTLLLESGTVLEEVWVCEPCISDLREEDGIDVQEAPVLLRGEDNDDPAGTA